MPKPDERTHHIVKSFILDDGTVNVARMAIFLKDEFGDMKTEDVEKTIADIIREHGGSVI